MENIRLDVIWSHFDEFVDNLGLSGLLGTAGLVFHSWLVLSAKKTNKKNFLIQFLSPVTTLQKKKISFSFFFVTCFAGSVSLKQDKSAREATLHKILVNISVFCLPALTDCFISFTYNKQKCQFSKTKYTCIKDTIWKQVLKCMQSCFSR